MFRMFSLLAVMGLFLAGCGSIPMQSQEVSDTMKLFPPPSEGKAGLYIFRTDTLSAGFVGGILKKDIWIDGKCIGESKPKTFFYEEIAAGVEHTISTESNPFFLPDELELIPEMGKNYFIEQYMEMKFLTGGAEAKLRLVDEAAGKAEVSRADMVVNGTCSEYGTVLRKIQTWAHQGDAPAQFLLAESYWFGNDTKSVGHVRLRDVLSLDSHLSQSGYTSTIDRGRGYLADMVVLDQMYPSQKYGSGKELSKIGVRKNMSLGMKWLQRAADQGFSYAQSNLALVYQYGAGVPKDERKAAEWFQKAADQGNAVAQRHLGLMYVSGQGVTRDQQKGCELLHKSNPATGPYVSISNLENFVDITSGMAASNDQDVIDAYNTYCAE